MGVTLDDILSDVEVQVLIEPADKSLAVLGHTEQGARRAALVSGIAAGVLGQLGHGARDAQPARCTARGCESMILRQPTGTTGSPWRRRARS
jgi:hypothetical protein